MRPGPPQRAGAAGAQQHAPARLPGDRPLADGSPGGRRAGTHSTDEDRRGGGGAAVGRPLVPDVAGGHPGGPRHAHPGRPPPPHRSPPAAPPAPPAPSGAPPPPRPRPPPR